MKNNMIFSSKQENKIFYLDINTVDWAGFFFALINYQEKIILP
jgi:hypothetical protein